MYWMRTSLLILAKDAGCLEVPIKVPIDFSCTIWKHYYMYPLITLVGFFFSVSNSKVPGFFSVHGCK